jgi:hypothetical protein
VEELSYLHIFTIAEKLRRKRQIIDKKAVFQSIPSLRNEGIALMVMPLNLPSYN